MQGSLEYNYEAVDPAEMAELNRFYQTQSVPETILNTAYPAAMRAYAGTYFYPEDDILTQQRFSGSELNALQQDYLNKRADYVSGFGSNPLTGFQKSPIPDVSHFVPFEQYSQEQIPDVRMQGFGSMFQGLAPFTRGAYYEQSPEGVRLRNTYTTPYGQRDVNVLLPMEPQ